MAAITSAVVGVGSAVAGYAGSRKQAKAADRAAAGTDAQFQVTRADMLGRQAALEAGTDTERARLNPYIQRGDQAGDMTAALSGVLGPAAQQQAYSQYQESPGVSFLREQGMRGLEQNLNVGGVGGGTRLKELSRFNQGLAMQDFSNQYNRLGSQADVGRAALSDSINARVAALSGGVSTATNIGQFGQQAQQQSNLARTGAAQARADGLSSIVEGGLGAAKMYSQFTPKL